MDAPREFYAVIVFWFTLGMSFTCFLLFAYMAIVDAGLRRREAQRAGRNLESMAQVGELAEKFSKSGFAPSAMACCILFALLGTAIGLALDKISMLPSFAGVMQ